MKNDELKIIEQLTGISPHLANDGFCSRGYVIDDGRIVFKFKKSPKVTYKTEIKALEYVNSLNLGINLQKVGWVSPDDSYLGLYGVTGESLETTTNYDYARAAKQLANALLKLHQAHPQDAEIISQTEEIAAWQKRYQKSHDTLKNYFSDTEINRLDNFFLRTAPKKLNELGEKLVFSHGDLGDGNIFIDDNGKVGIIDFSEMCYLDEAADFMDVGDDKLREAILDSYGADEILREKVRIRVLLRPLFVLGNYVKRNNDKHVQKLIKRIQHLLESNYDKL